MSNEHDFRLEEYRHLSAAIIGIDGRIMTVFGLSLAAAGTLLGVAAPAILVDAGPAGHISPLALAYWALAPAVLAAATLWVQLQLRRDIMRLGMYRKVFFEEDGVNGLQWESALSHFRKTYRGETNDPIPIVYWLIAGASGSLFWVAIRNAGGIRLGHLLVGSALVLLLMWLHRQWLQVVRSDVAHIETEWRRVKAALYAAQVPAGN